MSASPPRITGCSSRRYFTVIAPAYRGATCRNVLAINQDSYAIFALGEDGAWKKIFEMLAADADNEYAMIDSTIVRAHQHSAGAQKDGEDQAIGAQQGRIEHQNPRHDRRAGNPLAFFLTSGQAHDLQGADELLPTDAGRHLVGGQGFRRRRARHRASACRRKKFVIPPKSNRRFNASTTRNCTRRATSSENFYCKLKQYRAIATRYDKTARNFLGAIHLAAAVIWLN